MTIKNRLPASVCLLGPINVDVTMPIDTYPKEGDDAGAPSCSVETGGVVGNTAIVLSKLGVNAKLIGCIGDDIWGKLAADAFEQTGVDISGVSMLPGVNTGLNFAVVSKGGERTFFNAWGANIWDDTHKFPLHLISSADMLQVTGHPLSRPSNRSALLNAIEIAQSNDIPISMDTSIRPVFDSTSYIRAVIPKLKICILGYEEACYLVDHSDPHTIAQEILSQGPELVAVKLSGKGCVLANADECTTLPSYKVNTIDTTGAGDTFTAGIILGWLSKMDIRAIGMLANILGALATTVWGAGTKLPGTAEVLAYICGMNGQDQNKREADQILDLLG